MTAESDYKLLLVEDSPTDAGLIQANLRIGLGVVGVCRVDRLATAIETLSKESFAVILLDLNLPDSTGVDTFRRLAARANGTPIVVLSGMDDAQTSIDAVSAGADDYVQKNHYDAQTLARSVRFAIERNNRRSAERELLNVRNELDAAQRIQDSLYPDAPPSLDGLDIASGIRSAGIGCGDYFDFISLSCGRFMFVVGDVSGHGMGSAIVMAETRACLRTLADVSVRPQVMMTAMNRLIYAGTSEGMFVTLLMVIFDPQTRTYEYFNAGHPGWILRANSTEQLTTHQVPLGLVAELDYSASDSFELNSGDVLIMPTDGIQETPSGREMFGTARVLETVQQFRHLPAKDIVQQLFQAATVYGESETPEDDMTLVIIKAI